MIFVGGATPPPNLSWGGKPRKVNPNNSFDNENPAVIVKNFVKKYPKLETKAKLRGPKSEETKGKMSAAHKGKIHLPPRAKPWGGVRRNIKKKLHLLTLNVKK
jgi:hypothetical protein